MLKSIIKLLVVFLIQFTIVNSQNYNSLLKEIEKNNLDLKNLAKEFEAEKIGFKTGIYPSDPNAEIDYFLSNPGRFEFRLTQYVDFPSSYFYRSDLANLNIQKVEFELKLAKRKLIKNAKYLLLELIKLNKYEQILSDRLKNAEALEELANKRLVAGDINIIEKNKISFEKLNTEIQMQILAAELKSKNKELSILNGNLEIACHDTIYPNEIVSATNENIESKILASNLDYKTYSIDTLIKREEISLSKSLNLPGFQLGYRMDLFGDKTEHGIIFGISLPLWQNSNKVKFAELKNDAAHSRLMTKKIELSGTIAGFMEEYNSKLKSFEKFRNGLQLVSKPELLNKALNAGQISIIEYILELNTFYDSQVTLNNLEFDINRAGITINSYFE